MATKNYFIRTTGKGEFKHYVLINALTFDLVDMEFTSEDLAKEYAAKKSFNIVEYKED